VATEAKWTISQDGKTMVVQFPTTPPTTLQFDAAGVDDLIAMLRTGRARMLPAHDADVAVGEKVTAVHDPLWMTQAANGNALLHLRDPGFGWLHFLLPPAEAQHLGRLLLTQSEKQPEASPPKAH
jgi:hypothetical protein